jgi:hypothetical protein
MLKRIGMTFGPSDQILDGLKSIDRMTAVPFNSIESRSIEWVQANLKSDICRIDHIRWEDY